MNNLDSKKTKIIATYGPACSTPEMIHEMIKNGVDLFRLNMSHNSDFTELKAAVELIREESKKCKKHVGIFIDLQGPKMRCGGFKEGKATLITGDSVILTTETCNGNSKKFYVDYKYICNDVKPLDVIYIDDGRIKLQAVEVSKKEIKCNILNGGIVSNRKGINLPDTDLSISAFSEKDKTDLATGIKIGVDYVALSFVSTGLDIENFRNHLNSITNKKLQIIVKIEKKQAIENLNEIIEKADAIMVARGDLGVEAGIEIIPKLQKKIISKCNRSLKPVIVATQMLETMIQSKTATRAEVSDVANAIYDCCDAVMLSGETAVGIDPPNVIKVMNDICSAADKHRVEINRSLLTTEKNIFDKVSIASSICRAANSIAEQNNAKCLMVFTSSGNTPLIASKITTSLPIIAPTDSEEICRTMSLMRGVTPMMMPKKFSDIARWTDMINIAVKHALNLNWLNKNDIVIVTAGIPIGKSNGINSIRLITV